MPLFKSKEEKLAKKQAKEQERAEQRMNSELSSREYYLKELFSRIKNEKLKEMIRGLNVELTNF